MGIGGISIWQLLIILAIVVVLFGTKKLRNMGGDIGAAIKNFRSSMRDGEQEAENEQKPAIPPDASKPADTGGKVYDGQIASKDTQKTGT
jgi:sec-independent protein translocase protein TatA